MFERVLSLPTLPQQPTIKGNNNASLSCDRKRLKSRTRKTSGIQPRSLTLVDAAC
jgi:hypothetical protein